MRAIARVSGSILVLVPLACAACSPAKSAEGSPAPLQRSADAGGGGGLGLGSDSLVLAPPDHGFQLKTIGTDIQPGEDTEYCEIVAVPGDTTETYYVDQIDIEMVKHSHHLIVSALDESLPKYADLSVERSSTSGRPWVSTTSRSTRPPGGRGRSSASAASRTT